MKHDKLFVVDGTWLVRRQFHATNKGIIPGQEIVEGISPQQDPNIVVISFLQSLLKSIRDHDYAYKVVVTFDRGTYRYRPKTEHTEYKSTRVYDDTFQCCWDAGNTLVELLRNLGILSIQIPGLEADDLGYYYSHNSKECILHTTDRDWFLSVTPTTRIIRPGNEITTWDDLIKDHITDPYDLAIEKAIQGDGSDNIGSVSTGLSIDEAIKGFKERTLDIELLERIDNNLKLTRLDRIISDTEVHQIIEIQESLTRPANNLSLITNLSSIPNYPQYFLGVLRKYNRLHNK